MSHLLAPFRGLRGKLTLTYAVVTVGALLALEVLLLAALLLLTAFLDTNEHEYISDVVFTLSPQASRYLENDPPQLAGLQDWVEAVYSSGYASLEPQRAFDAPAAPIIQNYPLVVVSPEGKVLARTPEPPGQALPTYELPTVAGAERVLETALSGNFNPLRLYTFAPDGNYFLAVPLEDRASGEVLGALTLYIEPPPPLVLSYLPRFLGILLASSLVLLLGVAPFGALFGFVMARSLTRRLDELARAADAWSEGNFTIVPQDKARDEIGRLGHRMRHMAEQVQNLLQSRQELAALEERNRLARDLHDTVKQQNFATLMQIRAARNLLEQDLPAGSQHLASRQHLEEAEGLVKQSQQELKLLIAELRPSALEGQGLATALEQYVDMWSRTSQIRADLHVQGQRALPLTVEQALYRVVQEALANVARHSGATIVDVRLLYNNDWISLHVMDNGQGFDPTQDDPGFGLQSMRQRLNALGGTLHVDSQPQEGTTVVAKVPGGKGAALTSLKSQDSGNFSGPQV